MGCDSLPTPLALSPSLALPILHRLRYTQPERARDYRVPVEGVWMWLMFLPMAIITVSSLQMRRNPLGRVGSRWCGGLGSALRVW